MTGTRFVKCSECGEDCILGINSIIDDDQDRILCDGCSGVRRAVNGFVIEEYNAMPCACIDVAGDNPNCIVHGGGS